MDSVFIHYVFHVILGERLPLVRLSQEHIVYLQALTLPPPFHRGKTLAYRLLCVMMVRKHDIPPPKDILTHFYRVLHQGLVGQDQVCVTN